MKLFYEILRDEKNDNWIVSLILLISLFVCFDLFSKNFSWMAFNERDFGRASDFVLGKGLSHLGPEIIGGGNAPGPGIALLLSIPVLLFKSPVGVHILLQLVFVGTVGLTFILVKRHLNRTIAYLSLAFVLSNYNYVFFSFTAIHPGFIAFFNVLILFCFDRYFIDKSNKYLVMSGILLGLGIQIHMSLVVLYLVYPLALLYLYLQNLLNKKESLKILLLSFLGIFISLSYYLYFDYQNEFYNTFQIFNFINDENFRNIEKIEAMGPLFSLDWLYMKSWGSHPIYASYITLPAFVWTPEQFWRIDQFRLINGWIFLIWVFVGLCLVFYSKYENKKKFIQIAIICLVVLSFPIFYRGTTRFYLITHPFFEVLFAIATYMIFYHLKDYKKTRLLIIVGLVLSVTNNIYGMVLAKNVRESIVPDSKIHTIKSKTVNSNLYHPYAIFDHFMDVLLFELKITPKDLREKFYLYSGDENFYRTYVLPTFSHYELAYHGTYSNVNNESLGLDDDIGIVLVRNKDLPNFNSQKLDIVRIKKIKSFTAYYYRGPYFYSQERYNEYSQEEKRLINHKVDSKVINKKENEIYIEAIFEMKVKFKTLKYLHKLVLKNNSDNVLSGFTEIISSDLRQFEWQKESPYFIKNPSVRLLFKNGSHIDINLMDNNFYSKINKKPQGWENEIYERHGQTNEVSNLGNYYVPTPHGVSIKLSSQNLSNVKSAIFLNEGFDTVIPWSEVNSKPMFKEILF